MKTLYENLGGTYHEENGHLIPNVTLPEQTDYQIGKYGQLHLDYIKNHRRGRYTTLLTEGKLNAQLHEIDLEANEMMNFMRTVPLLSVVKWLKSPILNEWNCWKNNIDFDKSQIDEGSVGKWKNNCKV